MTRTSLVLLATLLALSPLPSLAQGGSSASEWNGGRALELIGRAQRQRAAASADTGLVNFQADARLYVYFYLDRPTTGERNLVKTDQLALEVLWQSPNRVKQRIVGWRDQKDLPTNINYHLDHLTVVLENFGNEIRLGDGDEVRGVPHPAGPEAGTFYDYRLSDSLTLNLPGSTEPLRVYQLQVRPKDESQPAFVGSVFVDRRAGDIVRMDFTFTSASYVDRYLDHINIKLDNGLWRGRFWLPNEQRVEIRRRIPGLDLPVGSIIRATMRVGNYRLNEPIPAQAFAGPTVVAVPRAQREAFPFEQELQEEVREEGLGPSIEMGEIQREAARLIREEALRRASRIGVSLPSASEVFRYNRAEGVALGVGGALGAVGPFRVGAQLGFAFAPEHAIASLDLSSARPGGTLGASLYLNRPRDLEVGPVASGAINTISALFAGEDFLDLHFASGGELTFAHSFSSGWGLHAVLRAEEQESAMEGTDFSLFGNDFRALLPIDEADLAVGASLAFRRASAAETARWWTADIRLDGGLINPWETDDCSAGAAGCRDAVQAQFIRPHVSLAWGRRWQERDAEVGVALRSGMALGDPPIQEFFFVGGRGTIPGYAFRSFAGDQFATLNTTYSQDLSSPWLRLRASGALGWARVSDYDPSSLALWRVRGTGALLPSLGIGAGVFHDIIQIDLFRGLADEGRWELIVEANRAFWDFL